MPLTLIPTPIGNLEDITLRALRILRGADLIACEDTRTSSVLLKHYGISAPLVPFHLHNENRCLPRLLEALREGKRVAVISDAGTPGISDPGWILLRRALDEGLEVDALPGPSAVLPALLLSGLTPHPFLFFGFPPEKPGERVKLFQSLVPLPWTLCFYVSPHKAARQMAEMREVMGDRSAALVREISKVYQEALRGPLSELVARLEAGLKGEMVLVVEGYSPEAAAAASEEEWRAEADALREAGRTVKETVLEITGRYPVAKNAVKEYLIRAQGDS
ncbi:MAG: 16S rRNA (cytidine(1402)-2'-O)-methyltransferase [Fretibacterium sp.]|nr:16S rRNA (cytidine(1402)-2'-O)-methyltransferase [Fretibacterium sp.]